MTQENVMADQRKKPLMRSLGEFFGHIIKGAKTDPGAPKRSVVRRQVEEEDRGDVVLRRTMIEEIEIKPGRKEEKDSSPEKEDGG
jgi:hypothetical protein